MHGKVKGRKRGNERGNEGGGAREEEEEEKRKTHHINMPLLPEPLHLRLTQARKTKHANLARDVVPAARGAAPLQPLAQAAAHLHDPAAHRAQIGLPLRKQRGVVEDPRRDARAVRGRVRDLGPLQDGQLRRHVRGCRGRLWARRGDEVERACALAVQAEVLCEGLRDAQLEALRDEVADRPGIAGEVTGGEALVRAVEKGEVPCLTHGGGDLLPLVLGWVDTGGVVSAGVEKDDGAPRCGAEGIEHAGDVEAPGGRREVGVGGSAEVDVGEDLCVVGPGGGGEVDCWFRLGGVEFGQEEAAEMDGTGAGDCLEGDDLESVRFSVFKKGLHSPPFRRNAFAAWMHMYRQDLLDFP